MVTTISEMTKLWDNVLKSIKSKIDNKWTFDYFFANSYIDSRDGDTLIIVAQSTVAKAELKNKHIDLILDTISEFEDDIYTIRIVTEDELQANKKHESSNVSHKVFVQENDQPIFFKDSILKPELTFDTFVVGNCNKEAHKAALYVAKNGGNLFNPLFIYSHSGLGKTHLLHAIGNEIKKGRMPNANILYIDTNDLVEEYIRFVRGEKESQSMKQFFKNVDVLLLDDVQLLSGKVKTAEMFFAIYQDMYNHGKRIIITSDKEPSELKGIEERLITRFSQGLTVRIDEPDLDTSVEILKRKIVAAGMDINKFDANVLLFLAEKYSTNVRDLEGAVQNLFLSCLDLSTEERFTMDVAIKAVSSIKGGKNIAAQLSEQKIINVVADYYNISPSDITGKVRTGQIALARHISMYLIRKHLDVPLKKIGDMFGGKDHTTVMSGISKVDKELKTNKQLQEAIEELEAKLK